MTHERKATIIGLAAVVMIVVIATFVVVKAALAHGLAPGEPESNLDPDRPIIRWDVPHHKGGGMFVFRGAVYRLYGADIPETDMSECTAEAQAGWRAVERLKVIWGQGAEFKSLPNTDRHDRQWSSWTLDGKDVSQMLIDEKLARKWGGPRAPRPSYCVPPKVHGVVP